MSAIPGSSMLSRRLRRRITLRNLRLASGLVLFAYVTSHLVNHALGNVSLAAMEAALDWIAPFWGLPGIGALLYGALAVHVALALWALYARRRYGWTTAEALQLALGLALPLLLVGHVVGTRLAYELYGVTRNYAQQLYVFWVASPDLGAMQALALVAAWVHGTIGIYFWLRLKRFFPAFAPLLLCAAALLPVMALLGYLHAGRTVVALAADPAWVIENAPVSVAESPQAAAQAATIAWWKAVILSAYGLGLLAAIGGRVARRALEHARGLVRVEYPDGRVSRVPRGTNVLEASRIAGVPHASVCGGRGRCSTCRVRVFGGTEAELAPANAAERLVLDRVGAGPNVRLACQLCPGHDIKVAPLIPPAAAFAEARRQASAAGEERFLVAMFVDMRGSTRMAEERLPFDTIFLINRFLEAVARAVGQNGGRPNQFLGDGMLALFGLEDGPEPAARQALAATAAVGREIAGLNALMAHDMPAPIRFGIGLHAGTAVLGEIGGRDNAHRVFTAIGDPVNVAARLQSMTKRLGVEAVVSSAVFEAAAIAPSGERQELAIDGRDGSVAAYGLVVAAEAGGVMV